MRYSLLFALVAAFEATNEWQAVSEDEPIPAGLDVQLNMETGERLVRLPQDLEPEHTKAPGASLVPITTDILDKLDVFEDLAHDIDRGQEIIKNHFASLDSVATSSSVYADKAGKILQIALRHNPSAVKALLNQDPGYPWRLVGDLENLSWRQLGIYSSIISTDLGLQSCALYTQRLVDRFAEAQWESPKLRKRFEAMAEDLLHMGALEGWSTTLQAQTLEARDADRQEAVLRALTAVHTLHPEDVSQEFLAWLSKAAYEKSALGEYAKEVRHEVFGNSKARRLKEDL